jgi:hypothetical protein
MTADEARLSTQAEHVEFQGKRWFVAVADFDDDGQGGGHWHLTLTAPEVIKKPKPKRCGHVDGVSVEGCRYCAAAFVAAVAENLGVEPPEQTRRVLDGR